MKLTISLFWGAIKIDWTRESKPEEKKPSKVSQEVNDELTRIQQRDEPWRKIHKDDPKMLELLKGRM